MYRQSCLKEKSRNSNKLWLITELFTAKLAFFLNKGNKGEESLAVNALRAYKGNRGIGQFIFLTSAVDGGEWLTSRPGRFTPGRDPRYPLKTRLGGPQRRSEHFPGEEDLLPVPEIEPRTVQLHRLHHSGCSAVFNDYCY